MSKSTIFGYLSGIDKLSGRQESWFDPGATLLSPVAAAEEAPAPMPLVWAYLVIAAVIGIFIFRLNTLQIANGQANQQLAAGNGVRVIETSAPRGGIVDDRGTSLVTNVASYNLVLIPAELPPDRKKRIASYAAVSQDFNLSKDDIVKRVDNAGLSSIEPIVLKTDLSRDDALVAELKLSSYPGFSVLTDLKRQYDTTPGLSHILGYVGSMTDADLTAHPNYLPTSLIGRTGIEAAYDSELRGTDGKQTVEVDAEGQIQRSVSDAPPQIGDTLHLTIDKGLEQFVADTLTKSMQANHANESVGIVMDPRTGALLASVSLPSYDNNAFSGRIPETTYNKVNSDPNKPLLDRTIDGQYPPGSTAKPVVAAGALQEHTITASTLLDTSAGAIKIGQWTFPDWEVHGVTDVKKAIAQSNDVFFYAVGGGWKNIPGLGPDRIKKYFNSFGFGESTGIDYSTEQTGLVPDPTWKKQVQHEDWYIGDTYHESIGQGDLLVTPLQETRAIAGIINGGTLVTPHVVSEIDSAGGVTKKTVSYPTQAIPVDADNLNTVREGMCQTVTGGSAQPLKTLPFTSGGKTGTAQYDNNNKSHAWYVGFAPCDNPQIVVTILVEGGGEGFTAAEPVAGQIMQYYMSHKP